MAKTPKKKAVVIKKTFAKWFTELKKHKKHHGHLHVSKESYPSLHNWLAKMRMEIRIHDKKMKRPSYQSYNITKAQYNQLKRIGFPPVGNYKKTEKEKEKTENKFYKKKRQLFKKK